MDFLKSITQGPVAGGVRDSFDGIPIFANFREMAQEVIPEQFFPLKESILPIDLIDDDMPRIHEQITAILKPLISVVDAKFMLPDMVTNNEMDIIKMMIALPDEMLAKVLKSAMDLFQQVAIFREGIVDTVDDTLPRIMGLMKEVSFGVSDVLRDGLAFKTQIMPGFLFGLVREVVSVASKVMKMDAIVSKLPLDMRPSERDLMKLLSVIDTQPGSMHRLDMLREPFPSDRLMDTWTSLPGIGEKSDFLASALPRGKVEILPVESTGDLVRGQFMFDTVPIPKAFDQFTNRFSWEHPGFRDIIPRLMTFEDGMTALIDFMERFTSKLDHEGRSILGSVMDGEMVVYNIAKFILEDMVLKGSMDAKDAALSIVTTFGDSLFGFTKNAMIGIVPELEDSKAFAAIDQTVSQSVEELMRFYADYVKIVGLSAFTIDEFYKGKMSAISNVVMDPRRSIIYEANDFNSALHDFAKSKAIMDPMEAHDFNYVK